MTRVNRLIATLFIAGALTGLAGCRCPYERPDELEPSLPLTVQDPVEAELELHKNLSLKPRG